MEANGTITRMTVIPPCDVNAKHGPAYADAKLSIGPWGYVCKECFELYQCKLGVGRGQELHLIGEKTGDSKFVQLSVCGDCRIVLANDDWSGIPDDKVEDYARRLIAGKQRELDGRKGNIVCGGEHKEDCDEVVGCGCEELGFCTTSCDLCKETDHGDRYAATILFDN